MGQKEYEEQLRELAQWISESRRIVFFGGAGVSTESGIPDFRSADGLYAEKRRYPPEQIVSHSFFLAHTEQFYDFYKERMLYPDAEPNAGRPGCGFGHTGADRRGAFKGPVRGTLKRDFYSICACKAA